MLRRRISIGSMPICLAALSNRFSVEAVDALYSGINAAAEHYGVDVIGGDTTASRSGLVISITAIGEAKKEQLSFRSGAKVNDIVCVTGDLGGALVGLQILEREKQVYLANPEMTPELDGFQYVTGRQLRPEARMDIIHELREMEIVPTSMIDVSDGLASELFHICKASGVGVTIYEDKLPIDKQTFDTACANSNGAIIGTAYIKALENATDVGETTKKFLKAIV